MWGARILPLLCMGAVLLWALRTGRSVTIDDLLDYTPRQPLLAALFLWLAFGFKSLSMVFPVIALFAVSGQLFPLPIALAVNLAGITITLTLPYLLGRAAELNYTDRLVQRYPKLLEIRRLREENGLFLSFIARAIGVLPCDVLSLYFGGTRMPYLPYITGAVLGFLPDLICATVLGQQIEDVHSPGFRITLAINILACVSSYLFYRWYKRKKLSA